MGATPKNKITRAERGKRRAGNTPTLNRQAAHTSIPLHKRGLVAQVLQTLGLSKTKTDATVASEPKKTAPKEKAVKAPVQKQERATKAVKTTVQKSATSRRAGKG